jgi:hypothetical protein
MLQTVTLMGDYRDGENLKSFRICYRISCMILLFSYKMLAKTTCDRLQKELTTLNVHS